MRRRVVLSPDAVRQFRALPAGARALLKDEMRVQLQQIDATEETRHRFRLRRPSAHADFELRVAEWRVFYRVEADEVRVMLIGRKRRNCLVIDRRRFTL
jgi:mRNA-degrading endonuclease RelE of RelBE toxin-antitoxin system